MAIADLAETRAAITEAQWLPPVLGPESAASDHGSATRSVAWYRLADAILSISADEPGLLAPFEQLYGDCAVPVWSGQEQPIVCCALWSSPHTPYVLLDFVAGAPRDAAAVALALLHPPVGGPSYSVSDGLPEWRTVGPVDGIGPLFAAQDNRVFVDLARTPIDFIVEFLVSITLAAQPNLLPVHAASLRIRDAGVLVVGTTHAGKTTTALHLAAHGHDLLGDEIALVRLDTASLLPFPRTLNLRPGPRDACLAAALNEARPQPAGSKAEEWSGPIGKGALFPGGSSEPVRLRAALFLDGFAGCPKLERFRLTLDDTAIFDDLAANEVTDASWGLAPDRRALRLLALAQTLSRIPCWRLTVGPPSETVDLIEQTLEDL